MKILKHDADTFLLHISGLYLVFLLLLFLPFSPLALCTERAAVSLVHWLLSAQYEAQARAGTVDRYSSCSPSAPSLAAWLPQLHLLSLFLCHSACQVVLALPLYFSFHSGSPPPFVPSIIGIVIASQCYLTRHTEWPHVGFPPHTHWRHICK